MSFCFLYNVVSENYSVQNSPLGGGGGGGGEGGSIASSRSKATAFKIFIFAQSYFILNSQIIDSSDNGATSCFKTYTSIAFTKIWVCA